jgi:uncharacterized secreted protein with C-terminal beta-propeller domain
MNMRLLLILVLIAGCAPAGPTRVDDADMALASALRPFDGCDALADQLREHALAEAGRSARAMTAPPMAAADAPMSMEAGAEATAGDGAFSTTNVQEAGVDEADIAKTDGSWLFSVADGALRVVDIRADQPAVAATVPLGGGFANDLLLHNDRLLVMGQAPQPRTQAPAPDGLMPPWTPQTRLWLIDVGDPTRPEVVSTMTFEGWAIATRLTGEIARVVVHSALELPMLEAPLPEERGDEQQAMQRHRERIENSSAADWLPRAELDDADPESLVDCSAVHEPPGFADLGLVTVLSLDMTARTLAPERAQAVLGAADTVYANDERLYVTTSRWPVVFPGPMPIEPLADTPVPLPAPAEPVPDDLVPAEPVPDDLVPAEPVPDPPAPTEPQTVTTEVHQFDLDGTGVTYSASGSVPGRLLSQWALSEHNGDLRVATTEDETIGGEASHSGVRILRRRDGDLREIGHVGDLGRGERIFAVRYVGDVAFVVTFRQVDPLYTLDLSDPTAPRVLGELKIPGYSAYLHPIDDNHILGVGQDADADGRTTGVQVSLFDVADLEHPRRVAQLGLGRDTMTSVEFDHRSFLHWPAEQLVVLPVEAWAQGRTGAMVLTVDPDSGLSERGIVAHTPRQGMHLPVQRAFVVDDRLITVSPVDVQISELQSLDPLGAVPFAQ